MPDAPDPSDLTEGGRYEVTSDTGWIPQPPDQDSRTDEGPARRRLRPPDDHPRERTDRVTDIELTRILQDMADHTPPGQFVGDILAQAARRIRKLEGELAAARGLTPTPNTEGITCAACGKEVESKEVADLSYIRFGKHLCRDDFQAAKTGVTP